MNVPNALSIFRIILVPVFGMVFFSGLPHAHLWAVGVFALAGLTDILDGRIARRLDQITLLGRVLDPLADKLMVMTVLLCMSKAGIIPFAVSILYACKECAQIVGSVFLLKHIKDMPPSNKWGKTATALLYVAVIATIVLPLPRWLSYALFIAALLAVFIALSTYIRIGITLLKESSK